MKKRILSIILAIAMIVCMIPLGTLTAFAETAEVKYMDWDSSTKKLVEQTKSVYTLMTESTISLENGVWYVVDGDVTVNDRITLVSGGTAHIILKDDAALTASAGIEVDAGQSLYIYGQAEGTGVLEAISEEDDIAGIGGSGSAGGTVIINGGIVIATGGEYGAGIGGGDSGNGGTVTINGGTVEAIGGGGGAGIGGGDSGNGGTVTINGGTVTATGGYGGAGIGSGGGNGKDGGTVTINGGTVTAIGEGGGAGIGGSGGNNGATVIINGGAVTAYGEDGGVGIGGGDSCGYHGELSVNPALTIVAGDDEDSAQQTELDGYLSERKACIKVLDWSELEDAYNTAYDLDSEDYTVSSWEDSGIESAITNAEDALDYKSIIYQEEINGLTSDLTDAMECLAERADVGELEEALSDAEEIIEEEYEQYEQDENWNDFLDAVEEGKTLLEEADDISAEDQSVISDAAKAISDAMDNLTQVPADYEEYDEAVTAAWEALYQPEWYTEDSYIELESVMLEFGELSEDLPKSQQDLVDMATNRILAALLELEEVEATEYTELLGLIEEYKGYIESGVVVREDHTNDSWTAFKGAIATAEALYADHITQQEEDTSDPHPVATAIVNLSTAYAGLVPKPADLTKLAQAVAAAELLDLDNYEDDEYKDAFTYALATAKGYVEGEPYGGFPGSYQAAIDYVKDELTNAQSSLNLKGADYTALDEAISAADEITDSTAFTAESWAKFYMAKKAAKNIASGLDFTHQEEITVAAEALASATEGLAELSTAQYNMIYEKQSDNWLMARQGLIIGGEVSDTIGRTIIPLTQDQIDSIEDYIWVVGFDGYKDVKVRIDCAYTWFYNVVDGNTEKVEAEAMGYAAFIIIDNDGTQDDNNTITGFGYYRIYNGDDCEDTEFMLDALYLDPQLAMIPVELRNTAWTAQINDYSENYDAVLTIGLDSATLSFDGNDYTAPLGYSGGSDLIFVADSEIELTITYDNGAVGLIEGYVDGGTICVTTVGDIVKMIDAEE